VNEDSPDIDEGEKRNVGELLQWKQEWENMVRYGLSETVEWVESVTGVWRWHDPFVVWLM